MEHKTILGSKSSFIFKCGILFFCVYCVKEALFQHIKNPYKFFIGRNAEFVHYFLQQLNPFRLLCCLKLVFSCYNSFLSSRALAGQNNSLQFIYAGFFKFFVISNDLIAISKSFQVDAQIVGRVEASSQKQVTIKSAESRADDDSGETPRSFRPHFRG